MSDAELGTAVLTIMRLARSLERVSAGLTPQQYRVLKYAGSGGERSARLARRLTVAKPTLTTTADGLVSAGLLHRETEAADRRVVRLCPTEAGERALSDADAAYTAWLGRLLADAGDAGPLLAALARLDIALDAALDQDLAATSATAP